MKTCINMRFLHVMIPIVFGLAQIRAARMAGYTGRAKIAY